MRTLWIAGLAALCMSATGSRVVVADGQETIVLRAKLSGLNEVPPISGPASGNFKATIHPDNSIDFTFTYQNLSAIPFQAHIHFAQRNVNGAVIIYLCGGPKPACPAAVSGTFSGTIAPADVLSVPAQGITAGDLAAALSFIGQGEGYTNMHTSNHPGGEIRGQISVQREDD
jgi:hypothetical protein